MKKLAAFPLVFAMSLVATGCAKHGASENGLADNSLDANVIPSDETIPENDSTTAELPSDNGLEADNSGDSGAAADANAAGANAF